MARDSGTYGPMMWKYNGGTNSAPAGGLDMMYLYGVGDHGGGPTRQDLDTALRWQKGDLVYPQINFSTAAQYFADLEKNKSELKIPTWDGELYFQYHRGVQTTQSEEKKRQSPERRADPQRGEGGVDRYAVWRARELSENASIALIGTLIRRTSISPGKTFCSTSFMTSCRARAFTSTTWTRRANMPWLRASTATSSARD